MTPEPRPPLARRPSRRRLLALAVALALPPAALAQPVYDTADPMPRLRGGLPALQEATPYPAEALAAGLSGRVLVSFVVDEQGRVTDEEVLRSAHPLLDEAALAGIRQARYEPGRIDGAPVAVRMVLPVTFALPDGADGVGEMAGPPAEAPADQVDEMPEIVGGLGALAERVRYPPEAEAEGIEGRVFVMFVVDGEGQVTEAEVVASAHPLLDEAALAAVRATRFRPGRQAGRPVPVRMVLPITFALPQER